MKILHPNMDTRALKQETQQFYVKNGICRTLLRATLQESIMKRLFLNKNNLVKKANNDLTYSQNNALEILLRISRANRLQSITDTNYNILSVIKKYILKYPIIDILKYVQKYRLSVKEFLHWLKEFMPALIQDLSNIRDTTIYSSICIICLLLICFIRQSSIIILIDNLIDLISKSIDIIIDRKKIEVKNLDKLKLYNNFKKMVKNLIFLMLLLFIIKYFIPLIMVSVVYFFGCFDAFDKLDTYLWYLFTI